MKVQAILDGARATGSREEVRAGESTDMVNKLQATLGRIDRTQRSTQQVRVITITRVHR